MDGAPSARDGAPHQCPFLSWLHSSIQFMLTTVAQFRWHHTTYIEGGGRTGENGERGECLAYGGTQTEGGKNDRSAAAAYGSFGQGGTFITANDGGGGGGGGTVAAVHVTTTLPAAADRLSTTRWNPTPTAKWTKAATTERATLFIASCSAFVCLLTQY